MKTTVSILLTLWAVHAAHANTIGYAQAPNYFKKDGRPAQYQPLHVLDGKEATAFCEASGTPSALQFGFKGPLKIDEVKISTGNGSSEKAFSEFARAKKLSLKTHSEARTFSIADQRGPQTVAIKPPLSGVYFTLEVLERYPAADAAAPACISDVIFSAGGKAKNGPFLASKLGFDAGRARFLGTWYAGLGGAPERFLSFFFDGTYRFVNEPLDGRNARSFAGAYQVAGSHVKLELPGKGPIEGRLKKGKGDGAPARTITFQGGDGPEGFTDPFRDSP